MAISKEAAGAVEIWVKPYQVSMILIPKLYNDFIFSVPLDSHGPHVSYLSDIRSDRLLRHA